MLLLPSVHFLRPWVSHYWISHSVTADSYPVLPDGCVDLVFVVSATHWQVLLYGTSTAPCPLALDAGTTYLGVCFAPGQARHLLDLPLDNLTDAALPAAGHVCLPFEALAEAVHRESPAQLAARLDQALMQQLAGCPVQEGHVDKALAGLRQGLAVQTLLADSGVGARQLQRLFREQVGVSLQTLASIRRVRRLARWLIADQQRSLADIALAVGYTDQSHMNRACRQLLGVTPATLRRDHVAFVQAGQAAR